MRTGREIKGGDLRLRQTNPAGPSEKISRGLLLGNAVEGAAFLDEV